MSELFLLLAFFSLLTGTALGFGLCLVTLTARRLLRERPLVVVQPVGGGLDEDEQIRFATLRAIKKVCPVRDNYVTYSEDQVKSAIDTLQDIGRWARTLPEGKVRDQYLGWVKYFWADWSKLSNPCFVPSGKKIELADAMDIPQVVL